MAATLQDVSSKLMKPAKDLAEWNFPLAQVLEDYYTLLEKPCDLNFGEAALVLQNSANVYVRRVEYLYQETSALNQSINDHEQADKESSGTNQRKHSGKSKIDFNNFEFVNFTKEINKNSNLKPVKHQKKFKFLSQRYPQLENTSRNKFSLEIFDVNGEIVGKKYDFRCSQQLSTSKMLVDEVTPNDFIEKQTSNNISEILETDLEVVNAFDSCSEYDDTFRDAGVFSPTQESGYGSMISSSHANTPTSRDLSDFSHTLNDSMRDRKDSLMSPADSSIECDKNLIPEPEQAQITKSTGEKFQPIENVIANTTEMNSTIDRTLRIRDSIETDAGYTSGDPDDIQQRILSPPKKIRRITRSSIINELNENTWKPIPFDENLPDKLPKSRTEFKLPCHISLLKYRTKSRKKKLSENSMKRKNLKLYLLNENDDTKKNNNSECDKKNLLLYSPTKSSMSFHVKDEIEELQKIIEQFFKSKLLIEECNNYRAIENSNMDLLGFESRIKEYNKDITENSESSKIFVDDLRVSADDCESSLRLSPPPEASCSYTPPQSPTYSTHFDSQDESDEFIDKSLDLNNDQKSHQKRIEQKMKQLQQEFNVRNECQEDTKKWHETIKALKAVEYRSTFHVHQYEKQILETLKKEKNQRLNFDVIAMQKEPDDIARLFVATLHLANTYNVQINVVKSNENSSMNLTLLNEDSKRRT